MPSDAAEALFQRALTLHRGGRTDEAVEAYAAAIAAAPHDHRLMVDFARLLFEADRPAEAAEVCTAVLTVRPPSAEVLRLRSAACARLLRLEAALADCDAAVALAPEDPEARLDQGLRLEALGRAEAAIESYDQALALSDLGQPAYLQALNYRGVALFGLKRYGEAMASLQRLLAVDPQHPSALGVYAQAKLAACDWDGFEGFAHALREAVESGEADAPPGTLAAWFDDPALLLKGARNHAARYMGEVARARPPATVRSHDRLRIAYLSADFCNHATAQLAIELFERHDRTRFDVSAISFGPDDGTALRAACVAAFETFLDARTMSDEAIAAWMRARRIDIAVDLKGFTGGARESVFGLRPAPLIVNYLGFPGSLGSEVYDYILADPVVAPMEMQPFFAEKIVHLPASYQPNDSRRGVPETTQTRAEVGLPETGFVFASFNNSYKITPAVFDVWMRLLAATEGSAFWLLDDNALATANLRKAAARRGVDPARLVFAPRVPPNAHLARQRLADLFLDTQPCGAHTTASDALWMGLPIVTCLGGAFAGRVAASLLHAVGLADLVAPDLAAYERLALDLARDPGEPPRYGRGWRRTDTVCPCSTGTSTDAGSRRRTRSCGRVTKAARRRRRSRWTRRGRRCNGRRSEPLAADGSAVGRPRMPQHPGTIGWLVGEGDRAALLARIPQRYARLVAHHVTLKPRAARGERAPAVQAAEVIGEADDGEGVQALVVRLDGTTARPGGGVYHITWSLGLGRRAVESNTVIAEHGWRAIDPAPITLTPGRF